METFVGCEKNMQTWSSGYAWRADRRDGEQPRRANTGNSALLDSDEFLEVDREKCTRASRTAQFVARCTGSEAATIVRVVMGLDGVETWSRLRANYNRRTTGDMFRV